MTKEVIVPLTNWPKGKLDPSEYSYEDDTIYIREDYDYKTDPYSLLVHERAHAEIANAEKHHTPKQPNNPNEYPANTHEQYAFSKQFASLQRKGYSFEDIKRGRIPGLEHKQSYLPILKQYWYFDEPTLSDFFIN